MEKLKPKFQFNKRQAVFCELKDYCVFSNEHDYVEVTKWTNGEGYDINVSAKGGDFTISLTHGQFSLVKKLIKSLERRDYETK